MNKKTPHAFILMLITVLTACGETEQSSQHNQTAAKGSPASSDSSKSINPIELELLTTPLNKQEFIGQVTPTAQVAAPCPFLSDETAIATAKTNWELKRRNTSNEQCFWSKNQGFSIKVTAEPLATAKPVRERVYNLDNPPLIKEQTEPGNNAMVLYDTTWDKERAYAMSFEQGDKLIMIYVTGLSTNADLLTTTAKEVANKLQNAPVINSQQKNIIAFNLCDTWSQNDIEAIIGQPMRTTNGNLDCKWETGNGDNLKQIRVMIFSGKSYPWESLIERGERNIPNIGERALMEKKRKKSQMPGHVLMNALYSNKLVTISVTDTISNHESVAVALAKNIDSRF